MAEQASSANSNPTSEQGSAADAPATKACAQCNKAETVSGGSDGEEGSSNLQPCNMSQKVCAKLAQEYAKTADVKMASRAPPKADTHRGGLQKWQFDT
ncbi:hypothetical protein PG999_001836 [Apiospora kogelbergensis]|uniref:Uncharacterized protein n=1 Tax=Apiospora kogelbergensis TaxID=1337665 RepID=A0AAW0R6M7_9PEZI